jgi:ATP-dependent Lhr-like helicase
VVRRRPGLDCRHFGNRLVYRDGLPIALLSGGKVQFVVTLDTAAQWEAQNRLLRSATPASMADLA